MPDYSDSDDEFGAMIYQSSLTAKRHQQQAEAAEDTKVDGTNDSNSQTKANDIINTIQTNNNNQTNQHFPYKLHSILEYASNSPIPNIHDCIKWNIDNKSFTIYNKEILMNEIVGLFSKQTKFRSFTRQLNLWGFTTSPNTNVWSHPHFIRGKLNEVEYIKRVEIKGTLKKGSTNDSGSPSSSNSSPSSMSSSGNPTNPRRRRERGSSSLAGDNPYAKTDQEDTNEKNPSKQQWGSGITLRNDNKWQAQITHHSKPLYIGVFDTKEVALLAVKLVRDKLADDDGESTLFYEGDELKRIIISARDEAYAYVEYESGREELMNDMSYDVQSSSTSEEEKVVGVAVTTEQDESQEEKEAGISSSDIIAKSMTQPPIDELPMAFIKAAAEAVVKGTKIVQPLEEAVGMATTEQDSPAKITSKKKVWPPPPVHTSEHPMHPLPNTKETDELEGLNKQESTVGEVTGGTVSKLSVSPVKIYKRQRPRLPPPMYMPPIPYGVPPPTLVHINKVTCNLEGCNNTAQQGGRCIKHGGKYIPKHYDMVHPTGYSQYGYLPPPPGNIHPGFSQHRYPPQPPLGYYYPHPPRRLTHTIVHNGHNDKLSSTNKDDNDDGSVKEKESSSNVIHGETANQVIQARQPPQAVNHVNYQQQQQHQPQQQQQQELNVTNRAGRKEREGFLMFLRMLMNNLKVHDKDTYTKAKSQIQVYYSTIQQAVDEYTPAKLRSLQEKLRTIVGEENWVKTRDSFRRYLQSLNAYESARKRKAGSTTDEDPDHKRLKTELVRSESSAPAEETDKEAMIRSKVEEKLRVKMSLGQQSRNPPSSPEMSHKIEEKLRIKMAQIQQKSTTASMLKSTDRLTVVDGALPLLASLGNTVHQKRSRTPSKKKQPISSKEAKQAKKKLLELSSKLLPPKPFTDYTIFFRIEKAYLTQIVDGGAVDPLVLAAHDPNHHDPLEWPRPERYQDVIMAPYWYSSLHKAKIEKKRKHRKVPGRMSLSEMSKTVSANWRNAIPEVIEYCRELAAAEQRKYHHACQEIQQRENEAEKNEVLEEKPQYDAALIQQYAIEEMKRRGYYASSMVAIASEVQDSSSKKTMAKKKRKKKKVAAVNEDHVLETTIQLQASINIPLRFSLGGNVEMDTHSSPIQATTTITTQPSPEAIDIAHIMTSLRRGDSESAKPTREDTTAAVANTDIDHLAGIVATNAGSTSKDDGMPEYEPELQSSHYF